MFEGNSLFWKTLNTAKEQIDQIKQADYGLPERMFYAQVSTWLNKLENKFIDDQSPIGNYSPWIFKWKRLTETTWSLNTNISTGIVSHSINAGFDMWSQEPIPGYLLWQVSAGPVSLSPTSPQDLVNKSHSLILPLSSSCRVNRESQWEIQHFEKIDEHTDTGQGSLVHSSHTVYFPDGTYVILDEEGKMTSEMYVYQDSPYIPWNEFTFYRGLA